MSYNPPLTPTIHTTTSDINLLLTDIEDLSSSNEKTNNNNDYMTLHRTACNMNQYFYKDPQTTFHVFTEYAHLKRGKCCGSGCRHCPYNHENVSLDKKIDRIQQPSFLCEGGSNKVNNDDNDVLFHSIPTMAASTTISKVKILFFSGGKDSYLALRYLVKQRIQNKANIFHIILLTTFDATSRMIAHQDIHIKIINKQAQHLGIPLVGIPLHRGGGTKQESYCDRIQRGLDFIHRQLPTNVIIDALCFGDLHLDHIRYWRDTNLSKLGYALEYPLWKVPYIKLIQELEASRVPIKISACTLHDDHTNNKVFVHHSNIQKGVSFTKSFYDDIMKNNNSSNSNSTIVEDDHTKEVDAFGENGEFHSVVEVWMVSRKQALGL